MVHSTLVITFGEPPPSCRNSRGFVRTNDRFLQAAIESLGFEFTEVGSIGSRYLRTKIEVLEDSELYCLVCETLLKCGLKQCLSHVIPQSCDHTHYGFDLTRQITPGEIDASELLRLQIRDLSRIADWVETTEQGYVLAASSKLKSRAELGWANTIIVPFASEAGRDALVAGELQGLALVAAVFDRPEKAHRQLYQMTSNVCLPQSLTPVQNVSGEHGLEGGIWDDRGYTPQFLRYRRSEIEAVGPFDIAHTLERTGYLPQHQRHDLIVSQKFRGHLAKRKLQVFDYVPVIIEE